MLVGMSSCSSDQPGNRNHLSGEQSPYLLQHADNPVHWYPWGEAAFERARSENKPIFLSIGYSTCHWCHVMAHESFESEAVADILNKDFINIKVDREERPDVDRVYMSFVQATTGQGGWPLSVWLSPDLKPFAGGTYFPPEDKYGRPGFKTVLNNIAKSWREEPSKIKEHGDKVFSALDEMNQKVPSVTDLDPAWIDQTYRKIRGEYDEQLGGFGHAPKFPRPVVYHFLLRYANGTEVPAGEAAQAKSMALHSLREMSKGGMYDQIGGGFHRYSVDEFWHVPHFEKMLYDQAQLVSTLNEAHLSSGDEFFARVANDVIGYVLRDLRSPQGGFYSAEDADSYASADPADSYPTDPAASGSGDHHSQKKEGAFYVWRAAELKELLTDDEFAAVEMQYGVPPDGNIRPASDPHGEMTGMNVLSVALPVNEVAKKLERKEAAVNESLTSARTKLFEAREQRPRPHLDDKVITAWNGLMISALAQTGARQGRQEYVDAAIAATEFILENLYEADSHQLYRSYRTQRSEVKGFADDYAFFIAGLLDLYQATGVVKYLVLARDLQGAMDERFWDTQRGGYYGVAAGEESVLLRMKEDYDGAEPSANSVAAENLMRLGDILKTGTYRERADAVLVAFSDHLQQMGYAAPRMLSVLGWLQNPPSQIVLTGAPDSPEVKALRKVACDIYDPYRVIAYGLAAADLPEPQDAFESLSLFSSNKAQAAVCRNFVCLEPVSEPEELREQLESGMSEFRPTL